MADYLCDCPLKLVEPAATEWHCQIHDLVKKATPYTGKGANKIKPGELAVVITGAEAVLYKTEGFGLFWGRNIPGPYWCQQKVLVEDYLVADINDFLKDHGTRLSEILTSEEIWQAVSNQPKVS